MITRLLSVRWCEEAAQKEWSELMGKKDYLYQARYIERTVPDEYATGVVAEPMDGSIHTWGALESVAEELSILEMLTHC